MRGQRIAYSAEEMAWLEANRLLVISDYHAAFRAAFGREDVTAPQLHGLRKRKGWKVGRAKGRTAGRRRRYSDAEIAWLSANRTMKIADYHRAFCAEFNRDDVSAAKLHALRKREGWSTGSTGRFEPGDVPANKGGKCAPGVGGRHPNAQRTQFRSGERRGRAAETYKPIGFERISDGYLVRKVNDDLPLQDRWRAVHLIRWEALNGPLPPSHCLKCLDGDRLNTDPTNWDLVHRGVLARLNGGRHKRGVAYDEAPDALKPAVMAVAKLAHAARQARKREAG